MKLLIVDNYEAMSRVAAQLIVNELSGHAHPNLVPATGNTPMGCYTELAAMTRRGEFDTSHLRIVQLDEYEGISAEDDRSLYGWMERSLINPLGIPPDRVIRFNTSSPDANTECLAFDQQVMAAGGVQIAVLGLGPNGHLGYNEPPSDAQSPTRVVPLTEESIDSATAYFGDRKRVPTHGMTLGMNRLLAADYILLMVSGEHKRDILHRTVYGEVTSDIPASFLQIAPRVTVIADHAAMPEDR